MCQIIVRTQIPAHAPIHHLRTFPRAPNKSTYGHTIVYCPTRAEGTIEDYVSSLKAADARSQFYSFVMRDGDFVLETEHLFYQMENECINQVVAIAEEEMAMVLLTHPTEKWRAFMDAYAT